MSRSVPCPASAYNVTLMLVSLVGCLRVPPDMVGNRVPDPGLSSNETVYIVYPISWIMTALAHGICFSLRPPTGRLYAISSPWKKAPLHLKRRQRFPEKTAAYAPLTMVTVISENPGRSLYLRYLPGILQVLCASRCFYTILLALPTYGKWSESPAKPSPQPCLVLLHNKGLASYSQIYCFRCCPNPAAFSS